MNLRPPPILQLRTGQRRVGTAETIEICLHGERRLLARRGFDHELLIELIQTLEAMA
jgi:hypothetical protein